MYKTVAGRKCVVNLMFIVIVLVIVCEFGVLCRLLQCNYILYNGIGLCHSITVNVHHIRFHHLSIPQPFTPDLKLMSFTNPFLHSHSCSFRTAYTDLNLYWLCLFYFLAMCARLS